MSNHHLRNPLISLKAKGLLSQMLSLPEDWDYTLKGLASINKESVDAIRTAVLELERAGYIVRHQGRDAKGKMTAIEYTIYEHPHLDNPVLENPISDNPMSDNPTQTNKEKPSTESQNTDSLSIQLCKEKGNGACVQKNVVKAYETVVKEHIEYEYLIQDRSIDKQRLDEIVALIVETLCTKRDVLHIAGDDYPTELVKARFMKLGYTHIQFVFHCMDNNTSKIRNIKQYLLAVLFNAPSTIGSYYSALVNHDMHSGQP